MRIIHAADIHLGSKMDSRFPIEFATKRQAEVRETFANLIEQAEKDKIPLILLSGDVFDSDRPFKKDKDFFFGLVKAHPSIDFLYLKGNHDLANDLIDDIPSNLKLFHDQWTSYRYGSIVISGIELAPSNISSFASTLSLKEEDYNIVLLHGTLAPNEINLTKLVGKHIDYLALGHIHKVNDGNLDNRGVYVYPGCLEGRGFDEPGEHGYYQLDTETHTHAFIPFAKRTIHIEEAHIDQAPNGFEAARKVKEQIRFNPNDIYRIILKGPIAFDVDGLVADVTEYLQPQAAYVEVKDQSEKQLDLSQYEHNPSVKGEFVRLVMNDPDISEEDKYKIIGLGLHSLDKQEIDL